jgi:hypothetical protein
MSRYRAIRICAIRGHFRLGPIVTAIGKEAFAPQEADVEAIMRQLFDGESIDLSVARHVGWPVSRHESNVPSRKP